MAAATSSAAQPHKWHCVVLYWAWKERSYQPPRRRSTWRRRRATRAVVDAYATWQRDVLGLAPATIARRLSALQGFYRYAVDEGLVARSPVDRVRRPKVSSESPRLGLDRDEL